MSRALIRDADRRLLQASARDADEHRRLCMAYGLGFHAAILAANDAVTGTKAPAMPAYEPGEKDDAA